MKFHLGLLLLAILGLGSSLLGEEQVRTRSSDSLPLDAKKPRDVPGKARLIRFKVDPEIRFLETLQPLYSFTTAPDVKKNDKVSFSEIKKDGPISVVKCEFSPGMTPEAAGIALEVVQFRMASVRGATHFAFLGADSEVENAILVAFSFSSVAKTRASLKKKGYSDVTFASVKELANAWVLEVLKEGQK